MGHFPGECRDAPGQTKILLIEDSASDALLMKALLNADTRYAVRTATNLSRGIAQLSRAQFNLVLLDLSLPDATGSEAVGQVHRAAPSTPIVALSGADDDELALEVIRGGAQDWLVKAQVDRSLLMRVIRYACERHRLLAELQGLALTDTLTGLYNRRGFLTIAEEQLKLANRTGDTLALAFIDLDGMKRINDEQGHEFGDLALVATAGILRSTFRSSDVIARLGGDEFIVLAIAAGGSFGARISKRLLQVRSQHNRSPGAVRVSFSVGFAEYVPGLSKQLSIEQLMTEADQAMYSEKQSHRASRTFQEGLAKKDCISRIDQHTPVALGTWDD